MLRYLCRWGGLRWLLLGVLGWKFSLKSFPQAGHFLPKGPDFLPPRLSAGLQLHLLFDQSFPLRLHHWDFMSQVVVDFHEARLLLLELQTHVRKTRENQEKHAEIWEETAEKTSLSSAPHFKKVHFVYTAIINVITPTPFLLRHAGLSASFICRKH